MAAARKAGTTAATKNTPTKRAAHKTNTAVVDDLPQVNTEAAVAEAVASAPSAKLEEVDVLDIRGLNLTSRVGLIGLLNQEGYIWADGLASLDDQSRLPCFLEADALRLDSNHKLVFPQSWDSITVIDLISAVKVRTDVNIFLDQPSPKYPETIEVGEATYVRVG